MLDNNGNNSGAESMLYCILKPSPPRSLEIDISATVGWPPSYGSQLSGLSWDEVPAITHHLPLTWSAPHI